MTSTTKPGFLRSAGAAALAVCLAAAPAAAQKPDAGGEGDRSAVNEEPGLIAPGQTLQGRLQRGDQQLDTGEYSDVYRLQGRAGQRLTVRMTGEGVDPYVLVRGNGLEQDNDDDPSRPGTRDSRLEVTLPRDGEYLVVATSYQPGEEGGYALTVEPGGRAESARRDERELPPELENGYQAEGEPAPPSRGAPPRAGARRVFAVLVGVSDYAGTANNLPYTDEDAEKLGDDLRRAGVLADQSVVLTNGQATVANVRAAFQRVAAQAGPDDLFLFFFSGHGVQQDVRVSASEPDGRQEDIVLRDGHISDEELARMFGAVRAGTSIVALDSCFSGGFARNVISRPGVMGLFSSEEDLTSLVASRFRAGGYLSYFLRTGLTGAADGDEDGQITAGELSTYLRREFRDNVRDVEATTTDGQSNYQNLVVDRGGVQVDAPLLTPVAARGARGAPAPVGSGKPDGDAEDAPEEPGFAGEDSGGK